MSTPPTLSGFPRYLPAVEICRRRQGSFEYFSFKKKRQRIPEMATLKTNMQSSSSSNCSTPRVLVSLSHCCASNLTDLGLSYQDFFVTSTSLPVSLINNYQTNCDCSYNNTDAVNRQGQLQRKQSVSVTPGTHSI